MRHARADDLGQAVDVERPDAGRASMRRRMASVQGSAPKTPTRRLALRDVDAHRGGLDQVMQE